MGNHSNKRTRPDLSPVKFLLDPIYDITAVGQRIDFKDRSYTVTHGVNPRKTKGLPPVVGFAGTLKRHGVNRKIRRQVRRSSSWSKAKEWQEDFQINNN